MIERVARALAIAAFGEEYGPADVAIAAKMERMARTAIAAMREPSEEMLSAYDACFEFSHNWQAMIDAALEE